MNGEEQRGDSTTQRGDRDKGATGTKQRLDHLKG